MGRISLLCIVSCLALGMPGPAVAGSGWSTTIFAGRFFHDHLADILFGGSVFTESHFMDSYVVTLSVGKASAEPAKLWSRPSA